MIDEFYDLFHHILDELKEKGEVTVEGCVDFISTKNFKYINFDNIVLDFLEAKNTGIRESLKEHIRSELKKLL